MSTAQAGEQRWTTTAYDVCGFVSLRDANGDLLSDDFHDLKSANKVRDAHNEIVASLQAEAAAIKQDWHKRLSHLREYIETEEPEAAIMHVDKFTALLNSTTAGAAFLAEKEREQQAAIHIAATCLLAGFKGEDGSITSAVDEMAKGVAALQERVEMLEKDKERLDWIEANLWTLRIDRRQNRTMRVALNPSINYEYDLFRSFREAIDAALTATPKQEN